ncbi:MAG: hypothetical protein AB8B87_26725 [Granulosicoccus sp.]
MPSRKPPMLSLGTPSRAILASLFFATLTYGTLPEIAIDSDDMVENNRIILSTSVYQCGTTLARWFGMVESELNDLFPNPGNFQNRDMGFMAG